MPDRNSPCPHCDAPLWLHPEQNIERGVYGQKRCDEALLRERALEYQ